MPTLYKVPDAVKDQAQLGIDLMDAGFLGGTHTGWNRAVQLTTKPHVDIKTLADMRTWFARHGPDAKNGGTSYPGYCRWKREFSNEKKNNRGAVAWLIWGGDAAYKWLKTIKIRDALSREFPKRKTSPKLSYLSC